MEQEIREVQKYIDLIVEFAIKYGLQVISAIIILIAGFWIAGRVARAMENLLVRRDIDVTLSRFLAAVAKAVVLVFVVIIAMGKFGISIAPFIAALGAVAFGSSLALQGPLSNYGAGLSIILTRPFVVGDTVTIRGVSGVVEEIRLAATRLTSEDKELILIPNKQVVGEILVNSYASKVVESSVGISYDDDPTKAVEIVLEVLENTPGVTHDPPPRAGIEAFGDYSINIGMRYWVPSVEYFQTMYRVNAGVYEKLRAADVTIPLPRMDVHMKKERPRKPSS
jgi:small conductance mechanosensitive channel